MYFCISVSVTPSHAAGNWKSLNQEIRPEKKKWTHKILTRKTFGPTKYPREKVFSQRNTQEKKFRTDEIPKYPRGQISDPRINHKKKVWTYKKPTRKNFRPTKYPRRYNGTMALDPRDLWWHAFPEVLHTRIIFAPTIRLCIKIT